MKSMKLIIAILLFAQTALGNGPKGINISGKIVEDASNVALSSAAVDFTIKVLSPDNCLLYSEQHLNTDLSATGGAFTFTIGEGTSPINVYSAGSPQTRANLLKVFSNSTAFVSGLSSEDQGMESTVCPGSYTPAAGDQRKVKIIFNTGSGGDRAILPYHNIGSVPYAMVAEEASSAAKATDADQLGGQPASAYALASDLGAAVPANETDPSVKAFAKANLPSCNAGEVLKASGGVLTCVSAGGSVAVATTTSTGIVQVGSGLLVDGAGLLTTDNATIKAGLGLGITDVAGLQTALNDRVLYSQMPTCTAGQTWTFVSPVGGFVCTSTSITASQVSDFSAAVDARIAADTTKLPLSGGTMTGAIDMNGQNLTLTGYITMNPSKSLHLSNNAVDPVGLTPADKGKIWFNSTSNEMKYWDGAQAKVIGTAGAGLQSMNGLSDNTQTFALGTSGTDFNINSASGVHTFNLPSASATNRGLLTAADYTAFSNKLSAVSGSALPSTQIWVGNAGGNAAAVSLSGDVTIDNAGVVTLKNTGTAGTYYKVTTDAQGRVSSGVTSLAASDVTGLQADLDAKVPYSQLATCTDNQTLKFVSPVGGFTCVNIAITASQVTDFSTAVDARIAADTTKLPVAGGTMTGTLNMGGQDIANAGNVSLASNKNLQLGSYAADPSTVGWGATEKGRTWFNTTSNQIKYWDGAAVQALGVSGAGLTSFNGQVGSTQTLAVPGTTGAAPNWSSSGNVHTLNIPLAATAGTTAGLLSKTDYDSFVAKQPAGNYVTALTGDVTAAGPGSAAATIAANAVTTGKIFDGTILGTDLNFTGVNTATSGIAVVDSTGKFNNFACGTTGDVATWTVTGWACQAPAATGVTSVATGTGLTGGPITGTGTILLANTAVTAGSYGSATQVGTFTVDAQGRLIAASNVTVTPAWSSITATPTTLAGYGITDGVLNNGGTPSMQTGTFASRPAFGTAGRIYISSDTNTIYRDTGSAWVAIGDGTGAGGTVSSVSSLNADIAVANGTTTPVLTLNSGTTGGVGDANKIAKLDATGLLAPAMIPSIDAAKIATGTLPVARGGTNSATALTNNKVMVSSGGAIVEAAAITANKALISDANGIPTHSAVTNTELGYLSGVTSAIQTQLDAKPSSTGWSNYSVIATNGSGTMTAVAGSAVGSILQYSATGPVYSTATFPSSTTANQLLFSSANNVVGGLTSANDSVLLTNGTGVPAWSAKTADTFTQYALLAGRSGGQVLNGGTAASNSLTLDSTANATKGYVLLNPTGGNVGIGTATPTIKLDVAGAVRVGTDATACAAGVAGAIRYNGGNVEYCNGTAWTAFAASGAGITSLNGLTGATQTFATGTTGTDFNINSTSTTHTFNFPSASGSNRGLLTSGDWTIFNNKLGTASTFSGDVSGTSSTMSVDKIKGKAVSVTAPTDTQFLVYNNGATQYAPVSMSGDATMANTGAVTLKNTGTAGTYTKVTTDAQGRVTSGTTLVAADIPGLDWAKITSGKPTTLSGYGITDGVQNNGGTPSMQTGTLAARPAFGTSGRLYIASDNNTLYRDTGSAWVAIGDGTGLTNFTESVNTSVPNATVPVVRLLATNAAANVDIALSPKGTGSLAAQVADNTTAGGNKRGDNTVDWQTIRTAATQVASGIWSTIGGGYGNTADGAVATVSGGFNNTASGSSAAVGGGEVNTASGIDSTVSGGNGNTASGDYAVVTGGALNVASGLASLASNRSTTAESLAQSTFGRYNMPKGGEDATNWVATDPLFVVGNGSGSGASRSNALMILKNGNVGIAKNSPAYKLDVTGDVNITGSFRINGTAIGSGSGTVTSITAGTGLTGGTITSIGTIGLGTELTGLNGLSTTGFVKRTGAGTYTTAAASLTADVSGVLPIANGGTNSSTALTNNQLMYSGAGAIKELGAMTDGQIVVGKNASAPQIVTMSGDVTVSNTGVTTVGKVNGTTVTGVGLATNNILQNTGAAITANNVLVSNGTATGVTALTSPASGVLTSSGTVPAWSTSLPATMGGTGQTSFAIGDLLYASTTTAMSRLPAATSGYVLTSNGAGTAPSWQAVSGAISGLTAGRVALSTGATSVGDSANFTFNSTTGAMAIGGSTPAFTSSGALTVQGAAGAATTVGNSGTTSSLVLQSGSGGISLAGNTSVSGSNTFATGTGAVSLNGPTTVAANQNLTMASGTGVHTQTFTGTTTDAASIVANSLTTGTALNLTTSSASLNSTDGLLYVANAGASTSGMVARIQSNSTAGTGLTVLASGNIGAGTAAPTSVLDINGAETMRGMAAPAVSPAGQGRIYFDSTSNTFKVSQNGGVYTDLVSTGTGDFKANGTVNMTGQLSSIAGTATAPGITFVGDTNTGIYTNVADTVSVAGGGAQVARFSSTDISLWSSSVGQYGSVATTAGITNSISNTAAGASTLSLQGGTSYGQILVNGNASPANGVVSGGFGMVGIGSTPLVLVNNGAERMRVDVAGNVGIGTIAPASILDINGAETMRGMAAPAVSAAGQGRIYFDSTANKYKVSQNGGAYADLVPAAGGGALSSITAATATNTIDNLNFGQIWNWSTASTQTPMTMNANALTTGSMLRLATSNASVNSTNGLLYVGNTGISTNGTVARIQSNSTAGSGVTVLANGNVGIGTPSPGSQLQISGATPFATISDTTTGTSSEAGLFLETDGASGGLSALSANFNNPAAWADSLLLYSDNTNTGGLRLHAHAGDIKFSTGWSPSVDRMIISSGGNVGIGITTPTSILDVNGAETMRGMAAPTVSAAGQGRIYFDSTANKYKVSQNGGAYTDLVSTGAGDFKADGTVAMTGQFDAASGSAAAPSISFATAQDAGLYNSASNVKVAAGGAAVATFYNSGLYMGVGNGAYLPLADSETTPSLSFYVDSNTGIYHPAADVIGFTAGGLERARIDASGNFGIGISSPTAKLHISNTETSTSGTKYGLAYDSAINAGASTATYKGISSSIYTSGAVSSSASVHAFSAYHDSGVGGNPGSIIGYFSNIGNTASSNYVAGARLTVGANADASSVYGLDTSVDVRSTTANAYGVKGYVYGNGSANVTNAYGVYANVSNAGTITNAYGLYVGTVVGTNKYSVYASDSTAPSYFAGNVGIGTNAPSSILDINGAETMRGMAAPAVSSAGQGRIYFDSTANKYKVSQNGSAYTDLGAAVPGGSNTNVQFNDSGVLAGASGLYWDKAQSFLGIGAAPNTPLWIQTSSSSPVTLVNTGMASGASMVLRLTKSNTVSDRAELAYIYNSTDLAQAIQLRHSGGGNLTLLKSGNVGIGIASPTTALQVSGVISPAADNTNTLGTAGLRFTTIYATNGTINTSDRRQKEDIENSDLGLDFINRLRPVSYRWKTGADKDQHYGLIAQETEKALNEVSRSNRKPASQGVVTYDRESDRYGIRYTELISPIIKAIQDLYESLVGTQKEVVALKAENAMIKAYLCKKEPTAPFCEANSSLQAR